MAKLYANSGDPDQMPHSVASDLSLHCLPITLLGASGLEWETYYFICKVTQNELNDPEGPENTN